MNTNDTASTAGDALDKALEFSAEEIMAAAEALKKSRETLEGQTEVQAEGLTFSQRHPGLVATAQVFGGIFALVAVATAAATVGSRVGMIGAPKDHPLYKS